MVQDEGGCTTRAIYIMRKRKLYLKNKEIVFFEFPSFKYHKNLRHAIFSRGTNPEPSRSPNLDLGRGGCSEYLNENLELIKDALSAKALVYLEQCHGKDIIVLRDIPEYDIYQCGRADALITNVKGLALLTRHADCQGIILFDPERKAISNIHCGWRGNVKNIIEETVNRMISEFGSNPSHLIAGIGPSLGPCCGEFRDWRKIFPPEFKRFREKGNNFNLWQLSKWQLIKAGLKESNIHISGICTKCRNDIFSSYRAGDKIGRFGVVVMLKETN